jgi:hypothetical protein
LRTLAAKCKVKILAASFCEARRGEYPTFGVVQRPTATATCFRASTPVARGSSRTMGRQYAMGQHFRIADICSDARHASGSLLCACVAAFWMFCVLKLPYFASEHESRRKRKGNWVRSLDLRFARFVFPTSWRPETWLPISTLTYRVRSNPTSALYLGFQL